jgi:hypothetical protein
MHLAKLFDKWEISGKLVGNSREKFGSSNHPGITGAANLSAQ